MNRIIQNGASCTIKHDIVVGSQIAFRTGETVTVETVSPNQQRPDYMYAVFSPELKKRFQLSDQDIKEIIQFEEPRHPKPGIFRMVFTKKFIIGLASVLVLLGVLIGVLAWKDAQTKNHARAELARMNQESEKWAAGQVAILTPLVNRYEELHNKWHSIPNTDQIEAGWSIYDTPETKAIEAELRGVIEQIIKSAPELGGVYPDPNDTTHMDDPTAGIKSVEDCRSYIRNLNGH